MKIATTLGACSVLAATSMLSADFVEFYSDGWCGMNIDGSTGEIGGGAEFCVIDIYAQFNSNESDGFPHTDTAVLNVFDADIGMTDGRGFEHADVAGEAWDPGFSFDLPSLGSHPHVDSFVVVGGDPGVMNNTVLDPNFDPSTGGFIPAGAGWFSGDPAALQGRVDGDLRTFLGRFVVSDNDAIGESLTFSLSLGYHYGPGTGTFFAGGSNSWAIVPAPGALAFLGLAGLAPRRRRG
ncbi:MAG: hypothetical protein HRT46_11805 [Deltaproteobacteria bacterium]|jgi:hypothetical protein|nr:hypothetical protein [Deltaproteobacteria bacterium]